MNQRHFKLRQSLASSSVAFIFQTLKRTLGQWLVRFNSFHRKKETIHEVVRPNENKMASILEDERPVTLLRMIGNLSDC